MTGRELVFSNPSVIRLITDRFVPVVDDVTSLQVSEDEVGRFFRHVAVQGRMKGRSRPDVSHQGIYAFTADGVTLASGNPLQADATLALLTEALDAWEARSRPDHAAATRSLAPDQRHENGYPNPGGAVLHGSSRPSPAGRPAAGTGALRLAVELRSRLA